MLEFDTAIQAYLRGGTLPDGSIPTYSDLIPGNATTGLAQVVATPLQDWGYGTELSCFDDFTPDMAEVDPNSTLAVVQSNYRRINTPAGFLGLISDDPEYGKDIQSLLQKGLTPSDIKEFQEGIQNQLLLDDRNKTVVCVITPSADLTSLSVDLSGTTSSGGNYSLTLALVDADVLIQAMNLDSRGTTSNA
jgi:hypothetical protein